MQFLNEMRNPDSNNRVTSLSAAVKCLLFRARSVSERMFVVNPHHRTGIARLASRSERDRNIGLIARNLTQ